MPKMKSHRGAKKRFRRTGTGKIKVRCANRSHILTKNTSKQKRQRRRYCILKACDVKSVKRMIN